MKVELEIPEAVEPVIKGVAEAAGISYAEVTWYMLVDYLSIVSAIELEVNNEKGND